MPIQTQNRPFTAARVSREYSGAKYEPSEVMVKLKSAPAPEQHLPYPVAETFELSEPGPESAGSTVYRLKLPQGVSVPEAVARMRNDESVEFAEPNLTFELPPMTARPAELETRTAAVDLDPNQWGLHNTGQTGGKPGADISAPQAWEITTGGRQGSGPLVALIDSGVDYTHPDLAANLWTNPGEIPGDGIDNDGNGVIDDVHGYNAFDDSGEVYDGYGHGTHCAGIIGAVGDNGIGISGVSPKANIMAVKIFSDEGRTNSAAILRGLQYSARMGAQITSDSWGGRLNSEAVYEGFKNHPALHIVAAGNQAYDNDRHDQFPANYDLDSIVAVAATTAIDQRASFSQWGAHNVDVAAPGDNILSTLPGERYGYMSGTSMATPHVAGAAALLMYKYPEASHDEIKQRLQYGSDRLPAMLGVSASNGRLNLARSLEDDTVAPGAPNDFKVGGLSITGGTVSWTSPGDDKWTSGGAPVVEMWRSDRPLTADNLAEAEKKQIDGAKEVGELISVPFASTPSEETSPVYFAMQSVDNVGNRSALRTASGLVPAGLVVYGDDFEGEKDSLTAEGDFHRLPVEGRGMVYSSEPGKAGSSKLSSVTTMPVSLAGKHNAHLKFDFESDLGSGERAIVWASEDGETWKREAFLTKKTDGWHTQIVDVSEHDGKEVRFKLTVDAAEGGNQGTIRLDRLRVLTDPVSE